MTHKRRFASVASAVVLVLSSAPAVRAQSAAAPAPQSVPASAVPQTPPVAPSTLVRPALDAVATAVSALKPDKWKRGSVRDEAAQDAGSILTDIQMHLPPLMSDADQAPALASRQVAVVRNVDALYDVLLRVFDAARIAGPGEDVASLQQALNTLNKARLALYDRLAQDSVTQEAAIAGLKTTIDKQAAQIAATPAPAPCPAPKKKKKTAK